MPVESYFIVFALGVRIWWRPSFWHWGIDRASDRDVYSFGPITIYN